MITTRKPPKVRKVASQLINPDLIDYAQRGEAVQIISDLTNNIMREVMQTNLVKLEIKGELVLKELMKNVYLGRNMPDGEKASGLAVSTKALELLGRYICMFKDVEIVDERTHESALRLVAQYELNKQEDAQNANA